MHSTDFKGLNFPKVPNSKIGRMRIKFDNNLNRWFNRNIGLWKSCSTYLVEEEVFNISMFRKVEKNISQNNDDDSYIISWWSDTEDCQLNLKPYFNSQGEIDVYIIGHQLYQKSSSAFDTRIISSIRQVDEHELIFQSNSDSYDSLEHVRLLDDDKYRSRVVYSWFNNDLKLVEYHHEIRS